MYSMYARSRRVLVNSYAGINDSRQSSVPEIWSTSKNFKML